MSEDLIKLLELQRKEYMKLIEQYQKAISEEVGDIIYEVAISLPSRQGFGWPMKPKGYDKRKLLNKIFKDAR